MLRPLALLVSFSALLVAACSSSGTTTATSGSTGGGGASTTSASSGGSDAGTADAGPIGGDRPVTVNVPPSYMPGKAAPLLILLHGYSASGAIEDAYLGFSAEAAKRGYLYAHPDGLVDSKGNHFWNASDACCNFDANPIDDSAYLTKLIVDISAHYTVDPKRVYFFGHSNGAFMSYRMACEHADKIAAIVSLAGAMPADTSKCSPAAPVALLEIHGTADAVIAYDGSAINGHPYPGATTSVADWVKLDGCSTTADTAVAPLDLDSSIPGDETTVTRYTTGCKPGGHAELWTIVGGSHIPVVSAAFTPNVFDFLAAHPKP